MSERKSCIKCGRGIHAEARVCPYCNWWQSDTPPAPAAQPQTPPAAAYVASPERDMRKKIFAGIAFVALLVVAFAIGSLIHGFEPSDIKAAQDEIKHGNTPTPAVTDTKPVPPPPKATVTLVPVNGDGSMVPPAEQPLTSTPTTDSAGATDATAMTSQQYAALAKQPQTPQQTQTVDPRSLTGNAYGGSTPAMARSERQHRHERQMAQQRTVQIQPVPEYQPVPRVSARGTARLSLSIDASGRVRDINVIRPAAGDMGRLIGAVQSWRFRPAMDNGQPVPARFTVDINFND